MRLLSVTTIVIGAALALSGCSKFQAPTADKKIDALNVIDASNLNDIMLTVADPNEAVTYFQKALKKEPDRIEFKRGLAQSLVRAKRASEAVLVYADIMKSGEASNEDRVNYADALIRTNEWALAEKQLNDTPPTYETYKRYRLEAMIADSHKKWKKADAFYETAAGLTTNPAPVLNNWGYSKLTRGDYKAAEKLFLEAITYDPKMFTAKNNLVMARAAQGKYTLPVIRMTQEERAKLLYSIAVLAMKNGDDDVARDLLQQAIDTHPRYFADAVRTLESLNQRAGI